jgi:hypothetical protein
MLLDRRARLPELINRVGVLLMAAALMLCGLLVALVLSLAVAPWLGAALALAALCGLVVIVSRWRPIREVMQNYPLVRPRPDDALPTSPLYYGLCALLLSLDAALVVWIGWRAAA